MQFPESWLREFCNPPLTTQELADTLTMAGLEVEELEPVAPPFTKIVVGEIKAAEQHPNADRLRVCQVDVGGPELLTRSEEHTSELQSQSNLVCRLLLEKKKLSMTKSTK